MVFQEVLTDDFSLFSLYPTQHARDMTLAAGDILNRIVRAIETDPNIKDNADKVFEEILKNRNTLVDPFTFHHSELVRV